MNIIDTIRKNIPKDCTTTRCQKEGCSVPLGQMMQDSILIDMDKYFPKKQRNIRRCDYLFVKPPKNKRATWIVPIELKRGDAKAGDIVRQLQAGANHANSIVPKVDNFQFVPVAFCSGYRRRVRLQFKNKANYISFRGKKVEVQPEKCGAPLAKVLGITS